MRGGAVNDRFELIYGFIHCRGRTSYSAGYAETGREAEAWVRNHREGFADPAEFPCDDPFRECRAALCPLKRQKPWYAAVAKPLQE